MNQAQAQAIAQAVASAVSQAVVTALTAVETTQHTGSNISGNKPLAVTTSTPATAVANEQASTELKYRSALTKLDNPAGINTAVATKQAQREAQMQAARRLIANPTSTLFDSVCSNQAGKVVPFMTLWYQYQRHLNGTPGNQVTAAQLQQRLDTVHTTIAAVQAVLVETEAVAANERQARQAASGIKQARQAQAAIKHNERVAAEATSKAPSYARLPVATGTKPLTGNQAQAVLHLVEKYNLTVAEATVIVRQASR
jgi:hypothetical protein